MKEVLFKEIQKNRILVLIILSVPLAIFFYGIHRQIIQGISFGAKPASDTSLITITIFYTFFLIFVYSLKITTIINNEGITVSYYPFFKNKLYSFNTLKSIEIEKYSPFFKYLGHGYRRGFDGSIAYTINGNHAILLIFKDGSRLRIGTQLPDKAKMALTKCNIIR